MQYQPAIDGLRALAVILVLLFHAKVPLFSGGYIGVDVFFVISGYLITALIRWEYSEGRFTIVRFYERRARRILPAFFLVTLITLCLGALLLLPSELARLGTSVVAATLFVSNFYFSRIQNYLLDETGTLPLVHTWSLGVEEQFYILFPIVTVTIMRFFGAHLSAALFGAMLGSLALSIYLVDAHPTAAFYFSLGRAWELLLGSWIAVTPVNHVVPHRLRSVLQGAGVVMILLATVSYDALTPFPGLAAVVPCLGTALILAWCRNTSTVVRVLSHPVLTGIGLISYPLYLWHWPLLVFARIGLLRDLHGVEIGGLYLLAGVLAAATWQYVEKPIRARRQASSGRSVLALAGGATCITVSLGGGLWATGGVWSTPPPADVTRILAAASDQDPQRSACHNWDRKSAAVLSICAMGDEAQLNFAFALWGDSNAGVLASAVDVAAKTLAKKGLQLTSDSCPPLLQTQLILRHRKTDCDVRNGAALELLQKYRIRKVILVAQWAWYAEGNGFKQQQQVWPVSLRPADETSVTENGGNALQHALTVTIDLLRAADINVIVVGPIPEIGWNVPAVLAALQWRQQPKPEGPAANEFFNRQRAVLPILKALERENVVVYPHERLCSSFCMVELEGKILYRDGEHLTIGGAELLQPMFVRALQHY